MTRAYVGLGSNMGDRAHLLWGAIHMLAFNPEVEVVAVSSIRETDPVGFADQPRFLNAAVALDTELAPRALLEPCSRSSASSGARATARASARARSTSTSCSTATRSSTSPASPFRILGCTSAVSSWSRSQSWTTS